MWITTKIQNKDQVLLEKPDGRTQVLAAVQRSLDNLQTEYVDLLLVHSPMAHGIHEKDWKGNEPQLRLQVIHAHGPPNAPVLFASYVRVLQLWEICQEILASGKARAIGVSNFAEHHLQELLNHPRTTVCASRPWHTSVLH